MSGKVMYNAMKGGVRSHEQPPLPIVYRADYTGIRIENSLSPLMTEYVRSRDVHHGPPCSPKGRMRGEFQKTCVQYG